MATITHHGGTRGVTGSCHRLTFKDGQAVLIDCGLLQGDDRGVDGAGSEPFRSPSIFPAKGRRSLGRCEPQQGVTFLTGRCASAAIAARAEDLEAYPRAAWKRPFSPFC